MGKLVIAKSAVFFLFIGRLDSITKQHRKCMLDCLKATRGLTNIESVGEQEVPTTKLITHPLQGMNVVKQYGGCTSIMR